MKLQDLAQLLGATPENAPLDAEITGVAGVEEAGPEHITFLTNNKYALKAKGSRAAAILVSPEFNAGGLAVLRHANPYLAFARALEIFYQPPRYEPGVHPMAAVHPSAKIGPRAHIGPFVAIDADVEIGADAVLLAHAVVYRGAKIGDRFLAHAHSVVREYCELGNDVVLQNGAVVGADGFGFARDGARGWHKIVQSGVVKLGDRVEVQTNSCVDRASLGETVVGSDTKIDNLTQVGHGCKLGEHVMLCAQVGLAGSTHVGNNVIFAGQAASAGHLTVGDGAIITAQSGLGGDVDPGATVSGSPAFENRKWLRAVMAFQKLPDMARELRKLTKTE